MSRRSGGTFLLVLGMLFLATAAFVNYEALTESYGAGPPYYSRTTNMDKWRDPLPELLIGDVVVVFIVGLLFRSGIRRIRGL
jgi:multisubunit Na+/H+ antiporter MnhC subunit